MSDVNIEAEFTLNEQPDIQADFSIKLTPDKVSQLENDLDFQTETQVNEAIQAESDVINARIDDEVNTLNSAIESEATTRAETDTSLQNGINTLNDDLTLEISNRTSADEVLQGNIDTVSSNLTTEISDRQDADATLQGNINTVAGDLSLEETARINADTTLQGNIDTLSGTVTSNYNTLDGKISNNKTSIDNHIADKTNPHEVTKSQVGLGNCDNTSDLDKPISTATQTALDGKQNTINDLSEIRTNASNGQSAYNTIQNYGDIVTYNASSFATSIQGQKADTALQPNDDISELNNDVGYITSASLPTVNNSTITFQKNDITVGDINLNQANNETINFNIPTTASDVNALPDTTTINDLTTTAQQNAIDSGANTTNIGQIATNTQAISTEATNRQNADNALQSQIDALVVASDVFDIVGTYAELQAYDISTVPVNDIIKVLVDSTHNNAATYYRCVENNNVKSWSYIGAEGAYYTKSEADGRFVEQTTTINGQALSNNITLDAGDVGALPDSTTIGNGTLTIQQNSTTIDTFGANDTGNTTVNISVPTDTGDLTNNAGYITGINSTDVTTALGYTPYNSSNPSGYQANVIETVKVNGTAQTVTSKAVDISVPTKVSQLTNDSGYTTNKGTVTSVNNVSPVNGNVTLSIPAAVTVDSALSTTSENPVQNKVITSALNNKVNTSDYVAYTASEVQTLWSSI